MKAYVIKNKEGKYWRSKFNKKGNILLTDDIVDAMPYEEDELKIIECPKDCTIVPITICEGDLEEENRVLKKALELAIQEINRLETDYKWAYIRASECLFEDFIQQAKESEKDG